MPIESNDVDMGAQPGVPAPTPVSNTASSRMHAETRQHEATERSLRSQVSELTRKTHQQSRLLLNAEALIRAMEAGVLSIRTSLSMRLGNTLLQSVRSPIGLLKLPVRLVRLLLEARRARTRPEGGGQLVPVPIPHEWFPTALREEIDAFCEQLHIQTTEPERFGESARDMAGTYASLPNDLSTVRVAAIMDEFTFSAYRECCDVLQLTPEGWKGELQSFRPHVLFVESAWHGKENTWYGKISNASTELRSLVSHCRATGVPIVFWSKEDPVHFKNFLPAARLADVVFTTDIDCIKHYKRELGHGRVFLLPFATDPGANNPIERYTRKAGFCFAGSYYLRYPVRQRDFDNVVEAASTVGEIEIYDRNHGKSNPSYAFPEKYRPYILGNLPFEKIDIAYKGYDFGININTVKHSQSMFARRVFDLLASNTTTVSNYARGMRVMLGDLVVSSDDPARLETLLQPLMANPVKRRKHRLAGLRKVLSQHTYKHRLAYLLEKVCHGRPALRQPHVTVIAYASCESELRSHLENYERQTWPAKELMICIARGFRPKVSPAKSDIHVLSIYQARARHVAQLSEYVGGFDADDYYGPNYLTDLALATSYSPTAVLGKIAHYRSAGGPPALNSDGAQYRISHGARRRRGIGLAALESVSVGEWAESISEETFSGECLAIDEFNYCEAADSSYGEVVGDLKELDHGIQLKQLLAIAEAMEPSLVGRGGAISHETTSLPGIRAPELTARLAAELGNKYLSVLLEGDTMQLASTLPPGKVAYAYLAGRFDPATLGFAEIGHCNLVATPADGLDLVLVYYDSAGNKISHSITKSASNVTLTLPEGIASVQIGIRCTKPGRYSVQSLLFAHVPLKVDEIVASAPYLLVAKNYPSYDDLYKHAFVHRRVVEYGRHGVDVDVFRIGGQGLSFYEFEGVDVTYGQAEHLRAMLQSQRYASVLVHFLDESMWSVLREVLDTTKIFVWAHGAEIQSASRRMFDHADATARERAIEMGDKRMRFWRAIFEEAHPNLRVVFVSRWFTEDVMSDVGVSLPEDCVRVIHNFIDTDLFRFVKKSPDQRKKILSIRPYESAKYANDLSVQAVLALRNKPFFEDLQFKFIGDGRLFEETMEPLRGMPNVSIERRFMTQAEIARMHAEYGVFLSPTRMDAQGVSRDEAMASGLVPVTNRVTAIPEFVDESCGILAEPDDAEGLAAGIELLYRDQGLFSSLSEAAAQRVRRQSGADQTIAQEIAEFARP